VPADPAAPPVNLLDDTVVSTSSGGELERLDLATGERIYYLMWKKSKVMADGRSIFEDVELRFDRAGVPYTVEADEAESAGKAGPTGEEPETVVFRRNVRMTGANGFSVESQEATYHGGEARIVCPGEMTFTRDRLSGYGVGAELFMEKSVFWLYDQARMTIAPESGGVPVVASGKRIGLAELDHYLKVE
jgi:hypothetical protein